MTETLGLSRRIRDEVRKDVTEEELVAASERRPLRRSDCVNGPRPCPHVWCTKHLGVEATSGGGIRFSYPNHPLGIRPVDEETPYEGESCAQDVADRGGSTLEEIGYYMNLTRERVRQIEVMAFKKFERRCRELGIEPADAFFHPTSER